MRLQIIQNSCCRIILRADARTHVADMHLELKLTTLSERRLFHVACQMYKIMNGLIKTPYFDTKIRPMNEQHALVTRSSTRNDILIPRVRTNFGERSFSIFGARLWNILSTALRECETIVSFKRLY